MLVLFRLEGPRDALDTVQAHWAGQPFPAIWRVNEEKNEKENIQLVRVVEYLR